MKSLLFIMLLLLLSRSPECHGRPIPAPSVSDLMRRAELAVVMIPKSTRLTTDKPDDGSFAQKDMSRYQPLETECTVSLVMKGEIKEDTIKIVHFGYAGNKPDFNGAVFIAFLFDPVHVISFPADKNLKQQPDISRPPVPYAHGPPEYLAFLRRLPDGRYAAVTPQYDAALSFRLLTTPWHSYHHDSRHATPGKE